MIRWLARRAFNRQVRRGYMRRQHGWNDPDELLRHFASGRVDLDYLGRILVKGSKY